MQAAAVFLSASPQCMDELLFVYRTQSFGYGFFMSKIILISLLNLFKRYKKEILSFFDVYIWTKNEKSVIIIN